MYADKNDLARFFATTPEMIPVYERLERRIMYSLKFLKTSTTNSWHGSKNRISSH